MKIILTSTLMSYGRKNRPIEKWLKTFAVKVKSASWNSLDDVRRDYPSADGVEVSNKKIVTVFNVKGNKYRLVVAIHYNTQRMYIRDFMTHAQYSKGTWKHRHGKIPEKT